MQGSRGRLRPVISASRRCDLPACHPEELAARLAAIGPQTIHTLVLWTKDPAPMMGSRVLLETLRRVDSVFLHLTVTGLGGTPVERNVPPWREVMGRVPDLLAALPGLRPEGICLRFDPLVRIVGGEGEWGNLDERLAGDILRAGRAAGISTVRTSVVTLYPKVVARLSRAGLAFPAGIEREAEDFLERVLSPLAAGMGMRLLTCVRPDTGPPGCFDGPTLRMLHPAGLPASRARDSSQREGCHCTRSMDIGSYRTCQHGCIYCYGSPATEH